MMQRIPKTIKELNAMYPKTPNKPKPRQTIIINQGGAANSTSSGAINIPDQYYFDNAQARDDYFAANPTELKDKLMVAVQVSPATAPITYGLSQYDQANTTWIDGIALAKGATGADGFSPEITVKESTATSYVLTVTNETTSFDTPNLLNGGAVSSVNAKAGDVVLTGEDIKTSADPSSNTIDVDMAAKLDIDQGIANSGKLLQVGSDGNVTPVAVTALLSYQITEDDYIDGLDNKILNDGVYTYSTFMPSVEHVINQQYESYIGDSAVIHRDGNVYLLDNGQSSTTPNPCIYKVDAVTADISKVAMPIAGVGSDPTKAILGDDNYIYAVSKYAPQSIIAIDEDDNVTTLSVGSSTSNHGSFYNYPRYIYGFETGGTATAKLSQQLKVYGGAVPLKTSKGVWFVCMPDASTLKHILLKDGAVVVNVNVTVSGTQAAARQSSVVDHASGDITSVASTNAAPTLVTVHADGTIDTIAITTGAFNGTVINNVRLIADDTDFYIIGAVRSATPYHGVVRVPKDGSTQILVSPAFVSSSNVFTCTGNVINTDQYLIFENFNVTTVANNVCIQVYDKSTDTMTFITKPGLLSANTTNIFEFNGDWYVYICANAQARYELYKLDIETTGVSMSLFAYNFMGTGDQPGVSCTLCLPSFVDTDIYLSSYASSYSKYRLTRVQADGTVTILPEFEVGKSVTPIVKKMGNIVIVLANQLSYRTEDAAFSYLKIDTTNNEYLSVGKNSLLYAAHGDTSLGDKVIGAGHIGADLKNFVLEQKQTDRKALVIGNEELATND